MNPSARHIFRGTVSKVGDQCMHRQVAPPGGTEVDVKGIDRLLQSITRVGARAGSGWKLPAL